MLPAAVAAQALPEAPGGSTLCRGGLLPRPSRKRRSPVLARLLTFLGLSLLLHVALLGGLAPLWPALTKVDPKGRATPVTLLVTLPEEPPKPEEPEPPEDKGQIVDVAPPEVEERPDQADYLAEHDQVVEEETRTDRFRVNPEVLAPTYSREDAVKFEDLQDLNVKDPSTGAKVGNDRFDPARDGNLASLPSPFTLTNKDGVQRPVPAASRDQSLSGSPSNDLVDEKLANAVALNTREILYAGYINRIKRLVSFYWSQNLDNLPHGLGLSKPRYDTVVYVVLDGDGALESIEVTGESGVTPLDDAVVQAFRIAGPFPNPPEQLIAKDGRVYLDNMGFTVQTGQARNPYQGVDPRAGVTYPGILKATR